jgi:hypothetical protein
MVGKLRLCRLAVCTQAAASSGMVLGDLFDPARSGGRDPASILIQIVIADRSRLPSAHCVGATRIPLSPLTQY